MWVVELRVAGLSEMTIINSFTSARDDCIINHVY